VATSINHIFEQMATPAKGPIVFNPDQRIYGQIDFAYRMHKKKKFTKWQPF